MTTRRPFGRARHLLLAGACCALSGIGVHAAIPSADTVATLDAEQITSQDLDARVGAKLASQQKEFDRREAELRMGFERSQASIRDRQLNKLVDEHVLALEAKAKHTTSEALLQAQVVAPITDSDLRVFYTQRSADIGQPFDTAAPKIREYLERSSRETAQRHYLDGLRKKNHASILLEPRREAVAADGPSRGPEHAPVTIVEFSDFQCPYCGRLEPVLVQILATYLDKVRLVYRDFPLPELHPQALKAAEAAQCAKAQGKFWEMHDLLFAEQQKLALQDLKDKAQRVGLEMATFSACLDSGRSHEALDINVREGEMLGIQGTPAMFINGRFLSGAVEEAELAAVIDDELERLHRHASR